MIREDVTPTRSTFNRRTVRHTCTHSCPVPLSLSWNGKNAWTLQPTVHDTLGSMFFLNLILDSKRVTRTMSSKQIKLKE